MLNGNHKNFKNFKSVENAEIGLAELDLKDKFMNPLFDQGDSYSYQKKDSSSDKALNNLLLVIPEFEKLVASYEQIIKEDKILDNTIKELNKIFKTALSSDNDQIEVIRSKSNILLNHIIELLVEDEVELERIETESFQVIDDYNKKDLYLKFKQQLEEIREKFLVTF
jgi:hypothetical protein